MNLRAVVLAGYKNSGKTTLAIDLCNFFDSKGLKCGVVKFVHHSLDKENTDTEKLSRAAFSVVGLSDEETSLYWKKRSSLLDVVSLMNVDVLLVEGGRDEIDYIPRIILPKSEKEIKELDNGLSLAVWGDYKIDSLPSLSKVDELGELILNKGFMLPNINCGACGKSSCFELAKEILKGNAKVEDCKTLFEEKVKVKINDQPMPLNPFVRGIVENTIKGLLSSLKGYVSGANISIEIKG